VHIRGLTVIYTPAAGPPVVAVDDLNLEIRPGDVVGILGESGSGKSTLATALLRLFAPGARCSGEILFRGQDLLTMGEPELRKLRGASVALIPQDPILSLNPVMKVGQQIGEVLRAHYDMGGRERRRRVEALLSEACFPDPGRIYAAYPHQLSGGERQRIVIAQAMACRPALVVADEPTSKLDPPVQVEILEMLAAMVRRTSAAMILITHDPAILAKFAARVAVMYTGRIVEEGTAQDIFQSPLHPYTQALLRLTGNHLGDPALWRARFPVIEGEAPSVARVEPGCRFEPRCPARMQACTNRNPTRYASSPSHLVSCFLHGH
jgi:oligopeptide/dipeptide ABC transporter ATP-binding protein